MLRAHMASNASQCHPQCNKWFPNTSNGIQKLPRAHKGNQELPRVATAPKIPQWHPRDLLAPRGTQWHPRAPKGIQGHNGNQGFRMAAKGTQRLQMLDASGSHKRYENEFLKVSTGMQKGSFLNVFTTFTHLFSNDFQCALM